MKPFQVFSVVLCGLLLGACNTNSSQPPVTPPVTPPVIEPSVSAAVAAYEPNETWDKAALLTYGVPSSEAAIAGSAQDKDWYKFQAKKGDKLEILVRTQSKYSTSSLDSVALLYGGAFLNDQTSPQAGNDDANLENNGDFGSKIKYTVPLDGTYSLLVTSRAINDGMDDNNALNVYDVIVNKVP